MNAAERSVAPNLWRGDLGPSDLPCDVLTEVLLDRAPGDGLWRLVDQGWAREHLPEMLLLRMDQHPTLRHKDVLAHTIKVTSQAPARLLVRLAALFHDIGKPATRAFHDGKVTFQHHEAVGARIAADRMSAMGYSDSVTGAVARLVEMSGRLKGCDGWSDSAVRRCVREAGDLLPDLIALARADCTSRHAHKRHALQESLDRFEATVARIAQADREATLRPEIDGNRVMEHLGVPPGRVVGEAVGYLLDIRKAEGDLGEAEILRRLDEWWAARER